MTVGEFLTSFGNWLLAVAAALIGYVVWRERTLSKVAQLSRDLERVDTDIGRLRDELEHQRSGSTNIANQLSAMQAQLAGITATLREMREDLKGKADK